MENEKMRITTGFYSADLFHGWEESDIELYDEADSAAKYADLCNAAIKEDYPEAQVEVLYQSGATGELPYNLQTRVNDIGVAGSGNEALDAERVDDIIGKVYAEYEWCIKREDWITLPAAALRFNVPLPTLRYHAVRGHFEAHKPDKRTWLVEAGSVEEWVKGRSK